MSVRYMLDRRRRRIVGYRDLRCRASVLRVKLREHDPGERYVAGEFEGGEAICGFNICATVITGGGRDDSDGDGAGRGLPAVETIRGRCATT